MENKKIRKDKEKERMMWKEIKIEIRSKNLRMGGKIRTSERERKADNIRDNV